MCNKKKLLCVLIVSISFCLLTAELKKPYIDVRDPTTVRKQIVAKALSCKGIPYKYGGLNSEGIDCSGLILLCFQNVTGSAVPRMVKNLYKVIIPIQRSELQPGDIVFFDTVGPLSHAGIYIGNNSVVHSVSSGSAPGVKISSFAEGYWKKTLSSFGRLLAPAQSLDEAPVKRSNSVPEESVAPTATAPTPTYNSAGSWDDYVEEQLDSFAAQKSRDAAGIQSDSDWKNRPQKKY